MKPRATITRAFQGLLTLSIWVSCSGPELPPVDPAELVVGLDRIVTSEYYFQNDGQAAKAGETVDLLPLYAATLQAARLTLQPESAEEARDALVTHLNQVDASELRELIYSCLNAYLGALPGGENTFVRTESRRFQDRESNSAGVGMVLHRQDDGRFLIVDVLEGSAAYRAEIEPGRELARVDGTEIRGRDVEEVVGRIVGTPESEVRLDYADGASFVLERGAVNFRGIINASWQLTGGGKAEYIMLRNAAADTPGQLRGLLGRLGQREAIVLDLRKHYHGTYEGCFAVADLFRRGARLGSLALRNGNERVFDADNEVLHEGRIFVILGKEASAFAITLAAALAPAPNVTVIGPDMPAHAFLSHVEELSGGIELRITNGVVNGPDGQALYRQQAQVDVEMPVDLPMRGPLESPDPNDPVQIRVGEMLGAPLAGGT